MAGHRPLVRTNGLRRRLFGAVLAWSLALAPAAAEPGEVRLACSQGARRLAETDISHPPVHVLLVPLLRKVPGTIENERWPEHPAAQLAAFYHTRFHARVVVLKGIRSWDDYHRQVELLPTGSFDRVVFIGHGGFDGPILNDGVIRQERSAGEATRAVESQPGVRHVLSFHYGRFGNLAFRDYVHDHWQQLMSMSDADVIHNLRRQEERLQPLDSACFNRRCPPAQLTAAEPQARAVRLKACDFACRDPVFVWRIHHDVAEDRFFQFTATLRSLTAKRGLVFFGSCNPGSRLTREPEPWEDEGLLIKSSLAGGPHESYVHLVAAAAGRTAAGPIGKSSAEDIVDRIRLLESGRFQRYLCVAEPPAAAAMN